MLKFVLLFGGIWTFVVMIFNVFIGWNVYHSVRSMNYPTAPGVVLASEVESHMGGKNNDTRMYSAQVNYQYRVGDQVYTSDRCRYGEMSSSGSGSARATVAKYPAGAEVEVRYNPRDPSDAVLEGGVSGDTRFMAVFLTPFNMIMLATWVMAGIAVFGRTGEPRIIEGAVTRVRLNTVPAVFGGLGAALAVSFPLLFVFAFLFDGSATAGQLMVHQGVTLAAGIAGWAWMMFRVDGGKYDLVIDPVRRVATMPRARVKEAGNLTDFDVPFAKIKEVRIEDSKTTKVGNQPVQDVVVECLGPSVIGPVRLRGFAEREDAERMAGWLRGRLGLA
jgi:hypothetical protein